MKFDLWGRDKGVLSPIISIIIIIMQLVYWSYGLWH